MDQANRSAGVRHALAAMVAGVIAFTDALRSRDVNTLGAVNGEARADDWSDGAPMSSMWQSRYTGLGTTGGDRLTGYVPTGVYPLSLQTLEALTNGDGIASRIVWDAPAECFRRGFRIVYRGGAAKGAELVPGMEIRARELAMESRIEDAFGRGRGYGFGALLPIVNGGYVPAGAPLDLRRVRHVDALVVFDARDVTVAAWRSPTSAVEFPEHAAYNVVSSELWSPGLVTVDASMVVQFGGRRTATRDRRQYYNGFDASALQAVWEVIRRYNSNRATAGHMLTDASIGVLKLKDLWKVLSSKRRTRFLEMMQTINESLWSGRIMPVSTDEEFERVNRSFEGIPEMAEADQADIAAAAEEPLSILFGKQAAGLGDKGDSDLKIWHGACASKQRTRLTPQVEWLVRLLAIEAGAADPENYGVEWPNLEQLSLREEADLLEVEKRTDDLLIAQGVDPLTVLRHRHGGSEYNHSPVLLTDAELKELEGRQAAEAERARKLTERLTGGGEGDDDEDGEKGKEEGDDPDDDAEKKPKGEDEDEDDEDKSEEEDPEEEEKKKPGKGE